MKNTHESTFRALRPAALDGIAADAYAGRRETDLAAARATPRETQRRRHMPRSSSRLLIAGVAAVSVAAATVAVVAGNSGTDDGHGGGRTPRPSVPVRRIDARTVLLASADSAAKAPVTSGRYWYTSERTTNYVDQLMPRPTRGHGFPTPTKLPYGGFVSTRQETWTARDGNDRSRTITGIGFATTFPTKGDEAKWKAAGSPALLDPRKRSVNDYDIPIRYLIGSEQVTMETLRKLPTSASRLDAELKKRWRADRANTTDMDGFTMFVWGTAQDLLAGPITPGTKAALYRVLADRPGIRYVGTVKDRLGRPGTALAMPSSDGESRLIVDQRTGELLAYESWAKGARYPRLSEAYQSMGWVSGLSKRL
jgi:hypothetical protein